ncbi:LysR family transcriptional regulator [Xylanibacillus composti]|uniref:LysR family transcriptional regulator n=1 Tax=Xylanibacillus composti TaxID=1572762 RepID=A0A8J4H2K0_9BACL|nr:LysR family transcriptional regulator [Xylanibacillus composti]MDT9723493.1 LysR family transcriptional regulator [Xylanibacillus composti]GIQ68470.1 LysR family transcriptional regulator [Xylanibacillus composti]
MNEALHVFCTVVEQKSLNQAARLLNLSQPALSRKIRQLEDSLETALFERKGKRLVLTEAGRVAYGYAQDMLRLERKFRDELLRLHPAPKRKLTIGASLTTLQATLPDLIAALSERFPDTDLKAVTGKTHEIVEMVCEHKVDFGLVASLIERKDTVCIPLFDDHLCLVLPALHPLAGRDSLSIQDLKDLPMILFSRGTWYRVLMDDLFLRYGIHPEIKMEIDSFEAIVRLVSTTRTATLLPQSYLRESTLSDNELVVVPVPELLQTVRTTSLIYSKSAGMQDTVSPIVRQAAAMFQQTADRSQRPHPSGSI